MPSKSFQLNQLLATASWRHVSIAVGCVHNNEKHRTMAGALSWESLSNRRCLWQASRAGVKQWTNLSCNEPGLLRVSCAGTLCAHLVQLVLPKCMHRHAAPMTVNCKSCLQCNAGMTTLYVKSLQTIPSLQATVLSVATNICVTVCLVACALCYHALPGHDLAAAHVWNAGSSRSGCFPRTAYQPMAAGNGTHSCWSTTGHQGLSQFSNSSTDTQTHEGNMSQR